MRPWLELILDRAQPRVLEYDDGMLLSRSDWPADFGEFIRRMNGADFEGAPYLVAHIPVPWNARTWIEDTLSTLYGVSSTDGDSDRGWLDIADVSLPKSTLPIGKFESNSLLVMSVRPDDHGSIYYWDWYSIYPWRGDFFRMRVEKACVGWPGWESIIRDPNHPHHAKVDDAIRNAMIVKLADSFSLFVQSLRLENAEHEPDR